MNASRVPLLFLLCVMSLAIGLPIAAVGCGRSSLEDSLLLDGGVTGKNCGPRTCPDGCCDASGVCRTGTDLQACGDVGEVCVDCAANNFTVCDLKSHSCGIATGTCDATSCPTGCCSVDGVCLAGNDPSACGTGAATCVDCAGNGSTCDPVDRICAGQCGPGTCNGCCVGDACEPGTDSTACGTTGLACDNCQALGETCSVSPTGASCTGTQSCSAANCKGCCIGNTCVGGGDNTACGLGGNQCQNCMSQGEVCSQTGPTVDTCVAAPTCGPANCPGCCSGNLCILSTTPLECGKNGAQCAPCPANDTCTAGACQPATTCGPASCATGCCSGNVCAQGNQDPTCGLGGTACQNCLTTGKSCIGNVCQAPPCSPANCAGCCSGNSCVLGNGPTQCGTGGQTCQNCQQIGDICGTGNVCQVPCGPGNCPNGCCDTSVNSCVGGFLDNRCGSSGASCVDCTATHSTCDTLQTPRVCADQGGTCPSTYAGCPGGKTTATLPTHTNVCAATDLSDAPGACSAGPESTSCQTFFAFLAGSNAACATCITPFEVPFTAETGVATCAAPFVGGTCNHELACAADCASTSCAGCGAGLTDACDTQIEGTGGECASLFTTAQTCLTGGSAVCNPSLPAYGGNYGSWLEAVGLAFCGP